jgi:predicted DNA-binding transcriptional regulator YafY
MAEKLHSIREILSILDQREPLMSKSLPQQFGVSERTIYRDIEVISSHFPVAFSRENKTY